MCEFRVQVLRLFLIKLRYKTQWWEANLSPKSVPKLRTHTLVVRSMVLPQEDAILWQNTLHLYLGSSKWIQKYFEVPWKGLTSGSIEHMKTTQCQQVWKAENWWLNSYFYRELMNLDTSRSPSFTNLEFSNLFFGQWWQCFSRVSFSNLLDDIKKLFYCRHHTQRLT